MESSDDRSSRMSLQEAVPFALVLVLALILRLRGLDTTGIGSDQSFTLGTAMRWVNGGDIPLAANISSVGFINPPMIEYLYAVALRIWPDVLSVSVLTMLSGIAAISISGYTASRLFGRRAALWAMLIFAINPWSVFYSQLIWNQTMVPLFSTLTFVSLVFYFAIEQRPIHLISSFVWAACMTQVHPGSIPQLLTMGVLFVLFWRRLRVWPLLVGLFTFLLIYLPYLLFEHGVGWRDLTRMLELMDQSSSSSAASVLVSFDLLQAEGILSGVGGARFFDGLATALLTLAILISFVLAVHSYANRKQGSATRNRFAAFTILFLWFLLPMLFYMRSSDLVYVQPYYLVGQIPAHFLFIGVALDWAQKRVKPPSWNLVPGRNQLGSKLVIWLVAPLPLLILLSWQLFFNVKHQDARALNLTTGAQVRHVRSAIKIGREQLAPRPDCLLVVVSEGHAFEQSYLSLLQEFVGSGRVILADGNHAVPLPEPCAIYLDALPGSRASTWIEEAAEEIANTQIYVPNATWRFYTLSHGERTRLIEQSKVVDELHQWENGVALRSYERGNLRAGAKLDVTMLWSVVSRPAERQYHLGTYLLTAEEQLVAQYDGPGFDSIQWRQGDMFLTWADIPIPLELLPGSYHLAVAYYSWPEIERVGLLSGQDTAFIEQIRLE